MSFEQYDYGIAEGSTMLHSPIRLQFKTNQNPFNITLSPVTIATAEMEGRGFFINSATITNSSKATSGSYSVYI